MRDELIARAGKGRTESLSRWLPWLKKKLRAAADRGEYHLSLVVNHDATRHALAHWCRLNGLDADVGYAKGCCVFQRDDGFNTLFVRWQDVSQWCEVR